MKGENMRKTRFISEPSCTALWFPSLYSQRLSPSTQIGASRRGISKTHRAMIHFDRKCRRMCICGSILKMSALRLSPSFQAPRATLFFNVQTNWINIPIPVPLAIFSNRFPRGIWFPVSPFLWIPVPMCQPTLFHIPSPSSGWPWGLPHSTELGGTAHFVVYVNDVFQSTSRSKWWPWLGQHSSCRKKNNSFFFTCKSTVNSIP